MGGGEKGREEKKIKKKNKIHCDLTASYEVFGFLEVVAASS